MAPLISVTICHPSFRNSFRLSIACLLLTVLFPFLYLRLDLWISCLSPLFLSLIDAPLFPVSQPPLSITLNLVNARVKLL